jgi:subtilisin family serine protease
MIVRPLSIDAAWEITGSSLGATQLRAKAQQRILPNVLRYYADTDEYIVRVPAGSSENAYARTLTSAGGYQYVEPNWRVYPNLTPNDPSFGSQWHLTKIRGPQAWDIIIGNPAQIIAYTDTGIDVNHPDLAPNRVPGYNAVDQVTEQNGGQVNDINGHGTHVAGIGSAVTNNAIGVAGVGWNFRIMMVRVSNQSGGSSSIEILTRGARWAVDNGAKTVSTSYSGVSNGAVETTGQYIRARGASYLWAAGNSNQNMSGFDHASVIIVGATTSTDARAGFSNYGVPIDVFAPGDTIFSTLRNNGYGNLSGTSMAAPCANGVIAMIYARNPGFTPDQAETKLFQSCIDLGAAGNDNVFGWGRVDLWNSVQGGATPVGPNAFQIIVGTQTGGNLASLQNSDDNRLLIAPFPPVSPVSPSAQMTCTGVSPTQTPTSLQIVIEQSAGVVPGTLMIEGYNWTNGTYEVLDTRAATGGDTTVTITIPSNFARFVESGTRNMRVRLSTFDAGAVAANWNVRYDMVRWLVGQ